METGGRREIILQDGEFMLRHAYETIRRWLAAATVQNALGL
jgi:hypothetical protein